MRAAFETTLSSNISSVSNSVPPGDLLAAEAGGCFEDETGDAPDVVAYNLRCRAGY
jgi:hypothetical protein